MCGMFYKRIPIMFCRSVVIEMVGFRVRNDGNGRLVLFEAAIRFIGFCYEYFAGAGMAAL